MLLISISSQRYQIDVFDQRPFHFGGCCRRHFSTSLATPASPAALPLPMPCAAANAPPLPCKKTLLQCCAAAANALHCRAALPLPCEDTTALRRCAAAATLPLPTPCADDLRCRYQRPALPTCAAAACPTKTPLRSAAALQLPTPCAANLRCRYQRPALPPLRCRCQ